MAVTIDIPGIGNVEAKNAASESTLRDLLKVMQGIEKEQKAENRKEDRKKGGDQDGPLDLIGKVGKAFGTIQKQGIALARGIGDVTREFELLNKHITGNIEKFANVGDSLERAATVVPIFGTMLGQVAAASLKLNDAFLEAARSGASFGDDANAFARAASSAGMTLDKFGSFVRANSEGLVGLGTTVDSGIQNFTRISRQLRATGSDLYALGFTTEEINKGIASYGALLRIQGRQGTMTNEQLAAASRNYMKEIDALAKATGEERSSIEAKMKDMARDAQFSSFMSTRSTDVQNSFNALLVKLGPTLGNFAKDFITTGTLTSQQTQEIGSLYGQEALDQLQTLRNLALQNQKVTSQQSDATVNTMIRAGKQVQQNFGETIAASGGALNHIAMANIDSNRLKENSDKEARDAQDAAVQAGKKFNEQIQKMQQRLSELSNYFVTVLANSGVLDSLMTGFNFMANIVSGLIVPIFKILAGAITVLGIVVENTILPVFEFLGNVVDSVSAFIEDNLSAVLAGLGTAFAGYTALLIANNLPMIASTAARYAETASIIAKTVATLALLSPLALLAIGFAALTSPLGIATVVIGSLIFAFKKLYDAGWNFSLVFEAIGDKLKGFALDYVDIWLSIAEKIASFFGKGDNIKIARQKIEEERTELKEKEEQRKQQVELNKAVRVAEKEKNKAAREENKLGQKNLDDKKRLMAENSKIDANSGPEALLKQFAKAEGSPLVPKDKFNDVAKAIGSPQTPKDKTEAAAKAETTKKEIESKAEEKAKAEESNRKFNEELEKKMREEKEGKPTIPTQESAESLLAQLNSNMARLVRIASEQKDIGERQLGVQRSLSGDLFAA